MGNAAALLYRSPANAIRDVLAVTSTHNVSGEIFSPPSPPAFESAEALAAPLDGTARFVSALYHNAISSRWYVLTFGTDTSLKVNNGQRNRSRDT